MAVNKISRQNHIINKKIENLLMITERIEKRMDKSETNNIDQTFVKVCNITFLLYMLFNYNYYVYYYFNQNVIKKVAKVLVKRSIYPTQEEFYDATNEFLNENHEDFIMKYSKRKWSTIYEKYFYKPVSYLRI